MKKSLLALSLLATFATVASANVEVYGVVNVGFGFQNRKVDHIPGADQATENNLRKLGVANVGYNTNLFKMVKGAYTGPRFGLKGSEKVSDAFTVGFKLEGGFSPLDGSLSDGLLFQREATLNVATPYGTVYVGRMGVLSGGAGSVGFFNGQANPFGGSWGDVIGGVSPYTASFSSRLNNPIAYVSPTFAGVKLYAQYSGGQQNSQNKSTDDRYMALGALASVGKLNVAAVVDTTLLGDGPQYNPISVTYKIDQGKEVTEGIVTSKKNPFSFNLAANYDFDTFKLFGSAQFFKNAKDLNKNIVDKFKDVKKDVANKDIDAAFLQDRFAELAPGHTLTVSKITKGVTQQGVINTLNSSLKYNGFGLTTGVSAPLGNGTVYASVGFMKAKLNTYLVEKTELGKMTRFGFGLGYDYKLSQRTTLYAGLGGIQDKYKGAEGDRKIKQRIFQAAAGICHKF